MSDMIWRTLDALPPGALFVTDDGTMAVKSEYKYYNTPDGQWLCVLLATGEYAHFEHGNKTLVQLVPAQPAPSVPAGVAQTIEAALHNERGKYEELLSAWKEGDGYAQRTVYKGAIECIDEAWEWWCEFVSAQRGEGGNE